jgi:hypothetical protein
MSVSWLLFRHSGKSSLKRLVLTAAAVALGTLMVFVFVAGINGLMARTERTNWRLNFYNNQVAEKPVKGVAPLKVSLALNTNLNQYHDKRINIVSMYAAGDNSPQLADLPTPEPGQYYCITGSRKSYREPP